MCNKIYRKSRLFFRFLVPFFSFLDGFITNNSAEDAKKAPRRTNFLAGHWLWGANHPKMCVV
jgi:hypothetical protein